MKQRPTLAHIVNPLTPPLGSDLNVAQPITFESMRQAKKWALQYGIEVEFRATVYAEDVNAIPVDFQHVRNLTRSVLDVATFEPLRKLPLLTDILTVGAEGTQADYLVYTNIDIGLLPNFYEAVVQLIEEGRDAFVINRRAIPLNWNQPEQMPLITALVGDPHPGWDCFVFPRTVLETYFLGNVCIGAAGIGLALILNLIRYARRFEEFKDFHLTFHLGKDGPWTQQHNTSYNQHNLREVAAILCKWKKEEGSLPPHSIINQWTQYLIREKFLEPDILAVRRVAPSLPLISNNNRSSTAVLVLGMHRSGTSCLASYLQARGVDMGERLLEGTKGNPRGHFEDEDYVTFHRKVLNRAGAEMDGLLPPQNFVFQPSSNEEKEALSILENKHDSMLWGWKDPRTCLLADFWLRHLPEVRTIAIFRHPLEVYESLLRRNTNIGIRVRDAQILDSYTQHNQRIAAVVMADPMHALVFSARDGFQRLPELNQAVNRALGHELPDPLDWKFHADELIQLPISEAVHQFFASLFPEAAAAFDRLNSLTEFPYSFAQSTAFDDFFKKAATLVYDAPSHTQELWLPLLLQWLGCQSDYRAEEIFRLQNELETVSSRIETERERRKQAERQLKGTLKKKHPSSDSMQKKAIHFLRQPRKWLAQRLRPPS